MYVRKAAVVGAGTMGGQIAQVIAAAGLPVLLRDIDSAALEAGLAEARRVTAAQVERLVAAGKLGEHAAGEQVEALLARITPVSDWSGFGEVDVVVEAIPERIELKQQVFAELDACVGGQALLASNTSSLSITQLGEATLRPERVVGLHFFYPASLMPLVEIVEGEETSQEALTDAVAFVQQIRKQPIRCLEVPGFVVNRILNSVISEVWRAQEEQGLSIAQIDEGLVAAGAVPVGPYRLVDLLGLDTVLHVAEHLADSYGEERFHVPEPMQRLVANGKLGAKRGGDGFYRPDGSAAVAGDAAPDIGALAEQVRLKGILEACLLLEEGVAGAREIDLGMMAGAGLEPGRGLLPPLMQADADGLDRVIERLEAACERFGERFEPPAILRRLVSQGRLGKASGQGFYAYPHPDEGPQTETVKYESAGDGVAVAWLSAGPMNAISAQVIEDLTVVYERAQADGARALLIASANPMVFSAGADIKGFASMDAKGARALADAAHRLFTRLGSGELATIAAVNSLAFGGGCELAMACDVRVAARSALFGQPEIKLGIIPGFGGTQRLPRLIGLAKAFEMNASGDPVLAEEAWELGLVTRCVEDHELHDAAHAWAAQLAARAPKALAAIKALAADTSLAAGIEDEKNAFEAVIATDDAREGIAAFLGKRPARFTGN